MAKKRIPQKAAGLAGQGEVVRLSSLERKIFGIPSLNARKEDARKVEAEPYVSLRYFDPSFQCLSEWTSDELRAFSGMIESLRGMTWDDIYRTGGKLGNKTGVGYTVHKDASRLPNSRRLEKLSPDLTFFELRVTGRARVHGFRTKSVFFLVWLDRNHDVYKM